MRLLPFFLASTLWVGGAADRSVPDVSMDSTIAVAVVDTIIDVRPGDRVEFEGMSGDLIIRGWNDDRISIDGDGESDVRVRRRGSAIQVSREGRGGRSRNFDAEIRVPKWMDVEVRGRSLDVWVEDLDGDVSVRNVSGDISIDQSRGAVEARTVEGEIEIKGARGGVSASSQSDDVLLIDVHGRVEAHSGSGDLTMVDIVSNSVQAETQDGDVTFSGTIADGGAYRFFVHDGDATIEIPGSANARFSVSTFDGEFHSDFPVRLDRFTGGRAFDFSIGSASAQVEIQVFDGEIRLLERDR